MAYWADGYDWRRHEVTLNELPHFRSDGLHFLHQRAADPEALPLLLAHGWPDSFLRYRRVLPLLPDFHLVVPSLPGYGFSDPPAEPGHVSRAAMAERLAGLMASLRLRPVRGVRRRTSAAAPSRRWPPRTRTGWSGCT